MEWTPPDKDHFVEKMARRSRRYPRKKGQQRNHDNYSLKLICVVYDTIMTESQKGEFIFTFGDLLDIRDRRAALKYCQKYLDRNYELANNKPKSSTNIS